MLVNICVVKLEWNILVNFGDGHNVLQFAVQEREMAAASSTPPPAQAQTKQEISNASLLRNPSKVIILRVSCFLSLTSLCFLLKNLSHC